MTGISEQQMAFKTW